MTNHPIVPTSELVTQWHKETHGLPIVAGRKTMDLVARAAQWGADQELEACCQWISQWHYTVGESRLETWLHAVRRRPNSLSLKEQSLALIDLIQGNKEMWDIKDLDIVRKALEQLDD